MYEGCLTIRVRKTWQVFGRRSNKHICSPQIERDQMPGLVSIPYQHNATVDFSRKKSLIRTRQITRCRATAILRRPQIKQYAVSNEGGGLQNLV